MHRSRRLREHFSKRRSRSRRSTESRHRRSIYQRPRHSLPHGGLRTCKPQYPSVQPRSVQPVSFCSTSRTDHPTTSYSPAPAASALPLRQAPASVLPLHRPARACSIRIFDLGLSARASAAPLHPPLPQPLPKTKPDRCPLARCIERKRRRKVERYRNHQRQHNGGTGQVQVGGP